MDEQSTSAGSQESAGATGGESQTQTTEAGEQSQTSEKTQTTGEQKPGTSNYVPYERFKEVNDKLKSMESKFEGLSPQLETVDRLRSAFNPQEDNEVFDSPEAFTNHLKGKFEKEWEAREQALRQDILSSVNTRYELEALKTEYPELKEDKEFRDIVVTQISMNPNKSPREIVAGVKKYLDAVTEKAKKSHEEEFLSKGAYSGRHSNNQPHESADADEVRKGIVGAGTKGGIF